MAKPKRSLEELEDGLKDALGHLPRYLPRELWRKRPEPRLDRNGKPLCVWCGGPLAAPWTRTPPHPNRRYCSNRCRVQYGRAHISGLIMKFDVPEEYVCAHCGKPLPLFQTGWSTAQYVRSNRKFCSGRCRVAAYRARRRAIAT